MNRRRIPESMLQPSLWLDFNENKHKYTWYGDDDFVPKGLKSATNSIKGFSHEFDAIEHSERIAKRDGVNAQELRDKWAKNAVDAADRGTAVHQEIERVMDKMQRTGNLSLHAGCPIVPDYIYGFKQWCIAHPEVAQGWVIPEHKICYPEYGIAGCVDLIASNFRGVPSIVDWKTSKTMEVQGYSNMRPPFQRGKLALPDANLYHYYLQLNVYRRILMDLYDYAAECMVVVHLEPGRFTEYDVPEMGDHVEKILECCLPQP